MHQVGDQPRLTGGVRRRRRPPPPHHHHDLFLKVVAVERLKLLLGMLAGNLTQISRSLSLFCPE